MKKALLLTLSFILCAHTGFARTDIKEDKVVEAQKIKTKRYFWTKQLDDLKITGKVKHVPENKNIIVPYFRVTFATGGKYINSVGGVTTSKTKVYSELNGVDEETMQAITDAMYADLIAQLEEAGYNVLPLDELASNENYQKLQESSDYPNIKKHKSQFTPQNRYFPKTVAVKAYMLAREVDALMLKADYTVNFIVLNANQKKFNILKDKSDVKVGQGINVFGELAVITEKGPVAFSIQQPISSEKSFGDVEDATTAMNKVSDGVAFVGSVLGGKLGNRQSTNSVVVNAEPGLYRAAVKDALNKSNMTLVSFMAASLNGEELEEADIQN